MKLYYDGKPVDASAGSGEVYSAEETRIGTWIDGRPLYRRVFTMMTVDEVNVDKAIGTLDLSGIDVVNFYGSFIDSNGSLCHHGGVYNIRDVYFSYSCYLNTNNMTVRMYASDKAYINKELISIIEYTKKV